MTLLLLALGCQGKDDPLPADDTATPTDDTSVTDSTPTDDTGTTVTGLDPAEVEAFLNRVQRDLRGGYASGAQVAIWKDGAIVLEAGVGSADPDAEVEITPDMLFQIGSDTKKLTAVAALQQVQAGAYALDDTLATVLPDLALARSPEWVGDATVHDVLSHQGGLFDYTPWDEAPEDAELSARTYGEFAEREHAMNPPGVFWNYSNPNFSVAGLLVETTAGRPYADVLRDEVLAPLGMTNTWTRRDDMPEGAPKARSYGIADYDSPDAFDLFATPTYTVRSMDPDEVADNGFTRPAGLFWSTASDMCRLAGFLANGDAAVLDDALRLEMAAPHVPLYPSLPGQSYGYGLFVLDGLDVSDEVRWDVPVWLHGGNTLSFTSTFWVFPEQDFAVCILSNGYGDDFTDSVLNAAERFGGMPTPVAPVGWPVVEVDPGGLVGTYQTGDLGAFTLTLAEDGTLTVDWPEMEARGANVGDTLSPYHNELFLLTLDGVDYDLTFIEGPDGTMYARNRVFVGVRAP